MDDLKRLGYPILIIFLSAFLIKLIDLYITGNFVSLLITIITVSALFLFGTSLNKSRRKEPNRYSKKYWLLLSLFFWY